MELSKSQKLLMPLAAGAVLLGGCSTEISTTHPILDPATVQLTNAYESCQVADVEVVEKKSEHTTQWETMPTGTIKITLDAVRNPVVANEPKSSVRYTRPTLQARGDPTDYHGRANNDDSQITQELNTGIFVLRPNQKGQEIMAVSAHATHSENVSPANAQDLYYFCGFVAVEIDSATKEITDAYSVQSSLVGGPAPIQEQIKISAPQ